MYLIFDSSGISKPKNWKAPFSDTFSWPRMIHLSWIILNEELKPIGDFDYIVSPEGFSIDSSIEGFAKIDMEDIEKKGAPLEDILIKFNESIGEVDYMLAHNLNFNECVIAAEYLRKGMNHDMFKKERFCLMQEATWYCKIPSRTGGYKWPTLSELHAVLFNTKYTPANNARADVIAAARCFIKLKKLGQFEDMFDDED